MSSFRLRTPGLYDSDISLAGTSNDVEVEKQIFTKYIAGKKGNTIISNTLDYVHTPENSSNSFFYKFIKPTGYTVKQMLFLFDNSEELDFNIKIRITDNLDVSEFNMNLVKKKESRILSYDFLNLEEYIYENILIEIASDSTNTFKINLIQVELSEN